MNEQWMHMLRRPALYERAGDSLWEDAHISKQMLAAHLSQDTDAASRRFETIDASCAWIGGQLSPGARVLDLGCGPGLYGVRLGRMGFSVTGVDISAGSLEYARLHDEMGRYLRLDYTRDDIPGEYDACLLIYCDYAALTPCERRATLSRARGVLRNGGSLMLDAFTPAFYAGHPARDETSWSVHPSGGFFSPLPYTLLEAKRVYPGGVRLDQYVVCQREQTRMFLVWDTPFVQDTLHAELSQAGFSPRGDYADCCGMPWRPNSPVLFSVFEKV